MFYCRPDKERDGMATRSSHGWQLPEARYRLDEIVRAALESAPQIVFDGHHRSVVVMSKDDYDALVEAAAMHRKKQGIDARTRKHLLSGGKGPQEDPLDEYTED